MKTATKQAIGYIRVSSAQQAQEGVSLEAQQAKIEQWCSANGYELVNVFKDEGISGKRMDTRPGLQDALASVKKGNAFVFYSMSRVARSTKDMIEIGELIDKKRGDMVSLNGEPINTTTASGKMIFEQQSSCPNVLWKFRGWWIGPPLFPHSAGLPLLHRQANQKWVVYALRGRSISRPVLTPHFVLHTYAIIKLCDNIVSKLKGEHFHENSNQTSHWLHPGVERTASPRGREP